MFWTKYVFLSLMFCFYNKKTRREVKVLHCKKRLAVFPSPAGMSLTKLSLAGNNLIIPGQFFENRQLYPNVFIWRPRIETKMVFSVFTQLSDKSLNNDHFLRKVFVQTCEKLISCNYFHKKCPVWFPYWWQFLSFCLNRKGQSNIFLFSRKFLRAFSIFTRPSP